MVAPGYDVGSAAIIFSLIVLPLSASRVRRVRLRDSLLVSVFCLGLGAWSYLWKGRAS